MTWRRSNGTPAGFLGVRAGRAWSSRKSTTLVIAVKLLDEYRQRQLPWLLAVVIKRASGDSSQVRAPSALAHLRVDDVCGRRSRAEARWVYVCDVALKTEAR
jgi:hypothetical protein